MHAVPLNLCPLILGLLLAAGRAMAEPAPGEAWALLIGCERYEKAPPLRYIVADVDALADTLFTRGDYRREHVARLHDKSGGGRRPDRATIEKTVTDFLARPAEDDRLVVYFSGHGFRDDKGRLYLAPIECDPANPEATGLPVQWLREQVAACKAKTKLVILDACHAGSERSAVRRQPVDSEAVGEEFRDLDRVVTIASSSAAQPSRLDHGHGHSLFTYWLIEGLKGSADSSRDGSVNIDELYDFVFRAVTDRSEDLGGRQTPVRINRAGVEGVPVAARLVPQPLETVLDDIASRLADRIIARKIGRVGVLKFVDATGAGDMLGLKYDKIGELCAEGIQRRLLEAAGDRFSVVDGRRVSDALRSTRFEPANLSDAGRMQALARSAGGMPAVVLGSLRSDVRLDGRAAGPAVVQIEARLTETEGSDDLGRAAGLAYLAPSEWAMTGASVQVEPEDFQPPRPAVFAAAHPPALEPIQNSVAAIERLEEKARDGNHPLTDPGFPFPVKIMIQQGRSLVERPGRIVDGRWVVELAPGEEYVIRVANATGRPVLMRLLVDGLNTRVEKEETKGVSTMVAGMRVNLDQARTWVLDPALPGVFKQDGVPLWDLKGFEKTEDDATETEFGRFTVGDVASSLAQRRGYTDQIGTITAAFYKPQTNGDRAAVGTGAGRTHREQVRRIKGYEVGPMLATVTIYYVAKAK